MNAETSEVRLDKWLWTVRAFKTRALAAEACRTAKVTVDGQPARASREVRPGQIVAVQLAGWTRTVRVLAAPPQRVGPALVAQQIEELTSPEERERGRAWAQQGLLARGPGEGRPTKRERRAFDRAFRGPYG